MNIHEVLKGVKDGSITIDTDGHGISRTGSFNAAINRIKETIIRKIEWEIDYWNGKAKDDISEDSYKKYLDKMESDDWVSVGDTLGIISIEYTCHNCGTTLYGYLKDINTISLVSFKVLYKRYPAIKCPFSSGLTPTVTSGIEFKTGKVAFVNHFGEFPETPHDKEYSEDYSLNYLMGRVRIAKYLSKLGIGYGQVGNTSVEILVAKDKKSIIVTEGFEMVEDDMSYHLEDPEGNECDDKTKELFNRIKELRKNYDSVGGSISLGVWRWMCADKSTIDEHQLKLNNDNEYKTEDVVWVDVIPGIWETTHYYDIDADDLIVSKLELVE